MLTVFIVFISIVLVFLGVVAFFHFNSKPEEVAIPESAPVIETPPAIPVNNTDVVDEIKPVLEEPVLSKVESQITDAVTAEVPVVKPKAKRGRKPGGKKKKSTKK